MEEVVMAIESDSLHSSNVLTCARCLVVDNENAGSVGVHNANVMRNIYCEGTQQKQLQNNEKRKKGLNTINQTNNFPV